MVEKLPARSVAVSSTVKVPPLPGVIQSSFGLPRSTVALFVQMTLGDDRAVQATYVAGELKYSRDPAEVPSR